MESIESDNKCMRAREVTSVVDLRESSTLSNLVSSEIPKLYTQSLTTWPMEEITTLPASTSTHTLKPKSVLTLPTKTRRNGQGWQSLV